MKYRTNVNAHEIKDIAKEICQKWKLAWIFIASPDGFYFNKCNDLAEGVTELTPLGLEWINREQQDYYQSLLGEFIKK